MKRLPLFHRPFLAKRVLEVGGGHAPYAGVTHAVDKFPDDNAQRAASLVLPAGVEFKQGDLEAIPFGSDPKFDFIYASHVFEHVKDPVRAASEINRVAQRGYIETPSPLREQISCPFPFDAATDFHYLFCWGSSNRLNVVRKTASTRAEFCDCENGELAREIFELKVKQGVAIEPLLPSASKTTRIYFKGHLELVEFMSFSEACRSGSCAYGSALAVRHYTSFPLRLFFKRFGQLREVLT